MDGMTMLRRLVNLREFLEYHKGNDPKLTDLEISRRLGYAGNSPVSMVMRGERDIPEDRIADWANALALTGKEREEFMELAYLEHSPMWLRHQYFRLKGRIEQLEKDKHSFIEQVQELKLSLAEIRKSKDRP